MPLPAQGARSRARLSVSVLLATAVAVFAASDAASAKRVASSTASSFALVSEYSWNNPNPAAPLWCLNEDDWHQRTWSGSLSGSLSGSERLCSGSVDYSGGLWWNAGGIGIQADAYVTGSLADIAITSPLGDVHHAVLVGSTTSKGVITNHYQACFVPTFSISSNVGGSPLPGGLWQFTVSGSLSKARFTVDAEMADVTFQQSHCPSSQQRLTV